MDIEIFPAEKSCEQGCPTCPMALKGKTITAKTVDPEVQKTFSVIESIFNQHKRSYNIHLTSTKLIPQIKYPKLIDMARFETNKSVAIGNNHKKFSSFIKKVISKNRIMPSRIGFSIVPSFPVIGEEDINLIKRICDEIGKWLFVQDGTEIDVTIRTNLIRMELFDSILPKLYEADYVHLRKLVNMLGTLTKHDTRVTDHESGYIYKTEYIADIDANRITISNRVIGSHKPDDIRQKNREQAILASIKSDEDVDFAIAPKGVMLMHSSLAINNPILWLTHNEFRKLTQKELIRKDFPMAKFVNNIIAENAVIYDVLPKYFVEGATFPTVDEWPYYFAMYRSKFFRNKHRKKPSK